ncbi:MAG: hypothetical protein M1444_04665 [Patescibacteria group bacterium]|nr:hypothetical protein [Patescibacteria group bacterium]
MPDDPIQDNQDQTTSQPEPQPEEAKPAEETPQPEEPTTSESPKEETPTDTPVETPTETPREEPKPTEEKKPEESKPSEPEVKIVEKEIIKEVPVEVIKEVIKEVRVVDEAELGKQLDEKLKSKLLENKKKADEARIQRKKSNLDRIVDLAKKKEINNQDVRDLLQVSQSTATNYLTELVKSGRLKLDKKAKATAYKG